VCRLHGLCDDGLSIPPQHHVRRNQYAQGGVRHEQLRRLLDDCEAWRRESGRGAVGRGCRVQDYCRRHGAEQQRVVDDLLTKGVDAIAISPVDPQNQTALIDAAAKRALVFTQDSDAPQSARTCYIGTDNVAAGRQAGQLIREAIPEGGAIMLFVGKLDARNAQERVQGIKEVLAGSNIRIIDVRTDDTDDVRAKANAADTLVRYPDVKGLVGLWSYNGPAILNAVREAGKVGRVRIITFDEADETLAGVKEGAIHATVVQQPYEFGYQAIKRMAQAVRGDRSFIPDTKQIIVPTLVVNRANVDEFTKRINTLRGR
jgi:ribose transport system substrate-binding protein